MVIVAVVVVVINACVFFLAVPFDRLCAALLLCSISGSNRGSVHMNVCVCVNVNRRNILLLLLFVCFAFTNSGDRASERGVVIGVVVVIAVHAVDFVFRFRVILR